MTDATTTTIVKEPGAHWSSAMVDRAVGGMSKVAASKTGIGPYVDHGGSVLLSLGSAATLGALLGAADEMIGTEPGGVSIDGALGAAFGLASMGLSSVSPAAARYTETLAACFTFGYGRRKSGSFLRTGGKQPTTEERASAPAPTKQPATPDEDEVIKAARKLKDQQGATT